MSEREKERIRLDRLLVDRGEFSSRAKAKAAVMAGCVYVDGRCVEKAGTRVRQHAELDVRDGGQRYVSRGGRKLEKAIKLFSPDVDGAVALDVGASTGGFTDCLLQHGAEHVFAVDVGYGQLAWTLRRDDRVTVMERVNARYLQAEELGRTVDLVTIDVAFISVLKILPAVSRCLRSGGELISLIKPQFEAGPERVGTGGIVRDPQVHVDVLTEVLGGVLKQGFDWKDLTFSPLTGGVKRGGNIEYLFFAVRNDGRRPQGILEASRVEAIKATVDEAFGHHGERE